MTSVEFLRGAAVEELPRDKLDVHDPYFATLVCVRAVKAAPALSDPNASGHQPLTRAP